MRSDQFDKEWVGVILGLLATVTGFISYGLLYTSVIKSHHTMEFFVNELFLGNPDYQPKVVSLSMLAVIPVFFLCNYLNKLKLMKGVLLSMFFMAILVVVLLF